MKGENFMLKRLSLIVTVLAFLSTSMLAQSDVSAPSSVKKHTVAKKTAPKKHVASKKSSKKQHLAAKKKPKKTTKKSVPA